MNKNILVLGLMAVFGACLISFAPANKIVYRYRAFAGCEKTDSFKISKTDFDQLITRALCAKDSADNLVKIESFEITYAERGLYQDSTGLPIVFTDYSMEICKGDTIPQHWQKRFNQNGYKGDTVYFDRIMVKDANNKGHQCKRIKCVIQ